MNVSSLTCSEGSLLDQERVRSAMITLYIAVFLSCFLGNILILVVIGCHSGMRTVTNFFLANLAVADLFVGVFCVVQNMIQLHGFGYAHWPFGAFLCHLYIFTLQLGPCSSAAILLLMSVERYIVVMYPVSARNLLTPKVVTIATVLAWTISFLSSIPYYSTAKHATWKGANETFHGCYRATTVQNCEEPTEVKCERRSLQEMTETALIVPQSNSMNFPEKLALKSTLRKNGEVSTLVHNNEQETKDTTQETRLKVIRLLIVVTVSYAVLTLPHHGRQLWLIWRPKNYHHCLMSPMALLQPICYLLLFLNSGCNPFLYAFFSERFRSALKDIIRCRNVREKNRKRIAASLRYRPQEQIRLVRSTTNSTIK